NVPRKSLVSKGDPHDAASKPASITGRLVVILTVSDLRGGADWYRRLSGAREHCYVNEHGVLEQVTLWEPGSGLHLCLATQAGADQAAFDETRCGLDHLEFVVAARKELDAWAMRLDELGIAYRREGGELHVQRHNYLP